MNEPESPPSLTKDELNLAELPVSLSCHRAPKGRHVIKLTEDMLDKTGERVHREWTVTGSYSYGLPLAIDDEVLLGLAYFLRADDFEHRKVHFTQYSLFRLLGWGDSQRSYQRLEASLRRLAGVRLESRESFWDHKEHCFLTRGFGLIDNYMLYRKDSKRSDQPFLSSVTFNETIFESFRSGFVKTLDLNLFLSLRYPIARKLFRLLDKKLHKSPVYEIDLMRLASRIALTDMAYPSFVKKHLAAPHEELIRVGFLNRVTMIRKGRSETLRYVMNPRSGWKRPAVRIESASDHPLVRELVARGITRDVARQLLAAHGEKRLADKLEVFDHLRIELSPLITKNPAGFLRQSIERDFAPPAGYVSRAEKQRRKEEADVARKREQNDAEAAELARAHHNAKLEAIWDGLPETERQRLEAEALAQMNQFATRHYRREKAEGRIASGHRTLRTYINQVLTSTYLAGSASTQD